MKLILRIKSDTNTDIVIGIGVYSGVHVEFSLEIGNKSK